MAEPSPPPEVESDWADQTRRVLTRDLLLRAARAQPAESHALQFRALHLNLSLVGEVADRRSLTARQRSLVEHDALDGLVQALRSFDPYGGEEFADFAAPFVEREIDDRLARTTAASPARAASRAGTTLSQRGLRLAARRVALVIAGRV